MSLAVDLKRAVEQHPDMIIVFMHWGQEYQSTPNAWQSMLTDFCFRHGAGMVIGSHPHVLQPVDWQRDKNRLVAYSLGNFVSGQRDRYRNGGMMLQVTLEKTEGADSARIQDVQYELAYVDRAQDARRTYRVLPVNMFANDSSRMIGKTARESLIQFRDDARMLLGQPGKNIVESSPSPASNHQ